MSVTPDPAFRGQNASTPLLPIAVVHVPKDFMVMEKCVMVKSVFSAIQCFSLNLINSYHLVSFSILVMHLLSICALTVML